MAIPTPPLGPKGGYAVIRPPFYRGYILLETDDGKTFKYVRNQVKPALGFGGLTGGDTGNWYYWGDTRGGFNQPINGDSYNNTGDTAGRIKFDYERLVTLWQSGVAAGVTTLVRFPELGGDTGTLTRRNREQLTGDNIAGDTYSYRFYGINAVTRTRILASKIISISVIEERFPEWYKTQPTYGMT